jgi:hypothetical protein
VDARLLAELARLRSRVEGLETTKTASAALRSVAAQPDARGLDAEKAPLSREELRERVRAHESALRTFYEATFAGEAKDAASRDDEARITTYLGGSEFSELRLDSVECQSTMCRVIITERNPSGDDPIAPMRGRGPFAYGGYSHVDSEGGKTVLYVGRAGREFPRVPPSEAL